MKKKFILLTTVVIAVFFLNFKSSSSKNNQSVNPIIGNASYLDKFGRLPDETTNETVRIKTHLEFAEKLLRNKPVSHLSAELQIKRNQLLDLLREYYTSEIFPRNFDFPDQRKPCFIDKDGRICAVGYLLEQTAGRDIAEAINKKFKYEELMAMNDKTLDDWIEGSGFTKEELATIQPTYGGGPNGEQNYVSPAYGISSSILSGTNLSTSIINSMQLSKGYKTKTIPVIGLISGAAQVSLGVIGMPKEYVYNGDVQTTKRTLSYINIGLGTTSMILSTINLLTNKKPPAEKNTSWNIFTFPTQSNQLGMAFSLTKRL